MSHRKFRIPLVALLVATLFVVWRLVLGHSADSTLVRLRARNLPTNPVELDRWYVAVPASNNLALAVLNASAAYRAPRDGTNTPYTGRMEIPPHPVDPQLLARWQAELADNQEFFDDLAAGRNRTASRYPINLRAGGATLLPHLAQMKGLAQFLALAALADAEAGHPAEAVRHVGDIVVVARSFDSEPLLISQLVRIAILRIAAGAAATSLPRADVDEAGWKGLQETFAAAAATNTFRNGLIGEIAMAAGILDASPADLARNLSNGSSTFASQFASTLYIASGIRAVDERFCMDRLSELLDASEHPFPEALRLSEAAAQRVDQEATRFARGAKILSFMLLPALDRSVKKQADCEAALRTAIVGCAVERHRLAHAGRLPDSLAELVPAFLAEVPVDPFDGQPLRYHRTNDSCVVYSVGPNREDDDGAKQPPAGKSGKSRPTDDIPFQVLR